MQRKIEFSLGEYYHVYNRGVDKRHIFMEFSDHERFLKLLYVSNGTRPFEFRFIQDKTPSEIDRDEPLVAIGAYCLMPNHFHILVKEIAEGGMSAFMEKLTTGYAKYFNTKHKRSGALFEGRFKAEHVDNDEYLKYLFSYIHLNPVKLVEPDWKEVGIHNLKKAQEFLNNYYYSSYADHLGFSRDEEAILSRSEFPEYFDKPSDFKQFVQDWLEFNPANQAEAEDRLPQYGRRSSVANVVRT